MNDAKVYAPFRCVAAFADGSRLLFDGLTREQARSTMDAAMEQHGDIGWWNWVTDENYRNGEYYKLIPPPPRFPFPILDLSDCQTEEERLKALQDPFEPDGAPIGVNPPTSTKARQGRFCGSWRASFCLFANCFSSGFSCAWKWPHFRVENFFKPLSFKAQDRPGRPAPGRPKAGPADRLRAIFLTPGKRSF